MLTLTFASAGAPAVPRAGREVNAWADDAGHVFARAFRDEAGCWVDWERLGRFALDAERRVTVSPVVGVAPATVVDLFERVVQPVLLPAFGGQALHASAAVTPSGALVFCGLSGSGKSTLAYAVGLEDGCRQIADDAVAFAAGDDEGPVVVPLPFRERLRPASLEYFAAALAPGSSPNPAARLGDAPVPLQAIVLMNQTAAADARLSPLTPSSAFSRVLTHGHTFDPSDPAAKSAMVESYLTLVEKTPVYQLDYRRSFADLSALVRLVRAIPRVGRD